MDKKALPSMEAICSKHTSLIKTKMKNNLKSVGVGILIFLVTAFALWIVAACADGFLADVPMTPQAQLVYDRAQESARQAMQTMCEAEKNLANAKINDYADELIELSEEDLIRLNIKRSQDCSNEDKEESESSPPVIQEDKAVIRWAADNEQEQRELQPGIPTPAYVCEGEESVIIEGTGVYCLPQSQWNIYSTIESPLREELIAMSWKESKFDCACIGDHGNSHGCYQIHRGYHPDVSVEQARDLWFAINWTIDRLRHYGYAENKRYALSCHNGCYNYSYADQVLNISKKYQSLTF